MKKIFSFGICRIISEQQEIKQYMLVKIDNKNSINDILRKAKKKKKINLKKNKKNDIERKKNPFK